MDSVASAGSGAQRGRPGAAPVQTLDRVVSVIEAAAVAGPCTLADLVRITGLAVRPHTDWRSHARATACSPGTTTVASASVAGSSAGVHGRRTRPDSRPRPVPCSARLVEETGESAQLYVREGDTRVCIATSERASGLRDTVPLGAVMPLSKGSGGKALLAWAADRAEFAVAAASWRRCGSRVLPRVSASARPASPA